jgi:hypothetical protein
MLSLVGILHKILTQLQDFLCLGLSSYSKKIHHFFQNKFNQAISYIPGTKPFHKRSQREVIERTRRWLKYFLENSKTLDPETRRKLLPSIRHYGYQL